MNRSRLILFVEFSRTFPWAYLKLFNTLEEFSCTDSGLTALEEDIPWSSTVQKLFFQRNYDITTVNSNAFKTATSLKQLDMWGMGAEVAIKGDAFRITSRTGSILQYYGSECPSEIASNAFGNVEGGPLWGSISVDWCDFPELTFRLMLKSAFDKGYQGKSI